MEILDMKFAGIHLAEQVEEAQRRKKGKLAVRARSPDDDFTHMLERDYAALRQLAQHEGRYTQHRDVEVSRSWWPGSARQLRCGQRPTIS
jgi:hypothetical protein